MLSEFDQIRVQVKIACDGSERERILEDLDRNECRIIYQDTKHFVQYGDLKEVKRQLAKHYNKEVRTIENWVRDPT